MSTVPSPETSSVPTPPIAKQVPTERTHHGDTVTDPYAWLTDPKDPEVIAYLEAENRYTDSLTGGLAGLRSDVFDEIKARTQETDLSVPVRKGNWWRYSRTVEGQQYAISCRRRVHDGEVTPPMPEDGKPLDGEEVLLDGNELAEGKAFFSLGAFAVSPDDKRLAYSTDFAGDERYTLRIKDLVTGEVLPDEVPDTHYGCAWSLDGSALFYTTVDEAWRPYRVWRHVIGTPTSDDVVVFEESDEKFWLGVGTSRDDKWLVIGTASKLTSEVWLLDAANPAGEFSVVAPRRFGVEYEVEVASDRLLILHNDGAENFELASAPLPGAGDTAVWTPVIAHRADTRLLSVDAFESCLMLYYRRDGMTGLSVLPPSGAGEEKPITFPEPLYTVGLGSNPEYSQTRFRIGYNSMVTPSTVYDYDIADGSLTQLKQQPVLPSPAGVAYSADDYEQFREWAAAPDGTLVPISIVCKKGTPRDGSAPCLLYGYGSYEHSIDPGFSITRLSLLDRGFVYAIAHIRGGGEMGRPWYDHGKMLEKKNTFTDFVACAAHVVAAGWTSASRLVARGGSAGGLLMGAVVNLAPSAFAGIVAQVPFVDALNSILDPTLPLTVTEWEEWGDPLHDPAVYAYMKSYTPYENVRPVAYPAIFALTSLNDTRVLYHEPAKWVARLRSAASGGPFLLKTEMEAGHGGRSGRYDAWQEEALVLAWIIETATGSAS
ncbi:S9 family peptidase [Trebonia kvetii]|uniref:S9 family peptidase n=1 Tax=Trebonia kvetii TaxID=2480626 RepID=A0A6P2BML8_9ACTN|nr:S9 family peptidase [Trebonia kvetii]TVY99866.1 S9 family peptidase [Trebonia kvetii]